MKELIYIAKQEFDRILHIDATPQQRTALFADCCRLNTLYMIAQAGSGHIGSSFSSLDIVSHLYLHELQPEDIYFSSKGHDVPGLYSVLLAKGLLDFSLIHSLRRLHGLPGHPDVGTPHIPTNTGSLGMGIAKARGMLRGKALSGKSGQVYVLTGDGELQEGQFWESLQPTVNNHFHQITVIVDHNKIQSDTWVSKVSDLGDLSTKFKAFGWHVARCDGHDVKAIAQVLQEFKQVKQQPKILIADTIKGKGVSFMEEMGDEQRLYRFHSGAPDMETYHRAAMELVDSIQPQLQQIGGGELSLTRLSYPQRPSLEGKQRLIPAYAQALLQQGGNRPDLLVLDADLALDCGLLPFEEKYPERFIECGIAEQDMVSQAGGIALQGGLPIVHSFACFLSTRANEQIYNNATERTKVIYVGSLAGLVPGAPGHSHQSVRDISALAAIPGLIMLEPADTHEVAMALDFCVNQTSMSSYIRLVSIPCEIPFQLPSDYHLQLGKGVALTQGNDGVIFGYGPVLLASAYNAARILWEEHHLRVKVVNLPWLNRVDVSWLRETIQGCPWVLSLDNHYVIGGQGDRLASAILESGISVRFSKLGVTDIPKCGENDEVLKAHGLDALGIVERVICIKLMSASRQ